jgi:hypothetical protein
MPTSRGNRAPASPVAVVSPRLPNPAWRPDLLCVRETVLQDEVAKLRSREGILVRRYKQASHLPTVCPQLRQITTNFLDHIDLNRPYKS